MTLRKNNDPEAAPTPIRFSKKALDFLVKAGKQNKEDWLEKNQAEYEKVLKKPFIALAIKLKVRLRPLAPKYHFPTKGLGRIKRPAFKVARGQPLYDVQYRRDPHFSYPQRVINLEFSGGDFETPLKIQKIVNVSFYEGNDKVFTVWRESCSLNGSVIKE